FCVINLKYKIMSQKHLYQVDLKWKEGRIGELSSPVLDTTIECATPPEFANGVANIWSPEHFYAAAISSCYMTTFLANAAKSRIEFEHFECTTEDESVPLQRQYLITQAETHPKVKLADQAQQQRMFRVIEKTIDYSFVTNCLKTKILLSP